MAWDAVDGLTLIIVLPIALYVAVRLGLWVMRFKVWHMDLPYHERLRLNQPDRRAA